MRDKRFVAEHMGGPLKLEQHRLLIEWACNCTKHVLSLGGEMTDERIKKALIVAEAWKDGNASAGDARKASVGAIAAANQLTDPVSVAIARSAGHAVAAAHMADHSLGAALYALKAVKIAGRSVREERIWQNEYLPGEIKELVLTSRAAKEKSFKLQL